jgi:hypothetical protein
MGDDLYIAASFRFRLKLPDRRRARVDRWKGITGYVRVRHCVNDAPLRRFEAA